jgi:hypothetical protein
LSGVVTLFPGSAATTFFPGGGNFLSFLEVGVLLDFEADPLEVELDFFISFSLVNNQPQFYLTSSLKVQA